MFFLTDHIDEEDFSYCYFILNLIVNSFILVRRCRLAFILLFLCKVGDMAYRINSHVRMLFVFS